MDVNPTDNNNNPNDNCGNWILFLLLLPLLLYLAIQIIQGIVILTGFILNIIAIAITVIMILVVVISILDTLNRYL